MSPELVTQLNAGWSEPVQVKLTGNEAQGYELVARRVEKDLDVKVFSYPIPLAEGVCNEGRPVLFNLADGSHLHHADDMTDCRGWVLTHAEAEALRREKA